MIQRTGKALQKTCFIEPKDDKIVVVTVNGCRMGAAMFVQTGFLLKSGSI